MYVCCMNIICKIIALPITFILGIVSAIFVIGFNLEDIGRAKNNNLNKRELIKKLSSDIDHFFIYEYWIKIIPLVRAIISGVIYYIIY